MKRLSLLFALGLLVSGCGSSSSTAPTSTNPTFVATLSPASENPPIVGAEATGAGNATVTLVTTKDAAGNVTAATATFVVNMSGFPSGTTINAAHIHGPNAPAGTNAGVLVSSLITPGANVLTNGSGSFTASNLPVTPDQANAILANPGNFYFNIHSALNGTGVARGQLVRQQ